MDGRMLERGKDVCSLGKGCDHYGKGKKGKGD